MLNQVILIGRITRDLELKKTQDNLSVLEFTLACRSDQKSKNDKPDYVNCEAWRGAAEYLHSYAGKGDLILAKGSIKTNYYEKDGNKSYKTYVLCNKVEIVLKKGDRVAFNPDLASSFQKDEELSLFTEEEEEE